MKKLFITVAILVTMSLPALAAEKNDSNWIFRLGAAHVSPDDDSGSVLGGGVGVESSTALGATFTYLFDDNWGLELLLATPFSHDIEGTGALSGLDIGETKQLPPTVNVVYHWGENTKYHVGAGINYTKFFHEKTSSALDTALGADTELKLDSSTGFAVKFGFETPITEEWNFTGSVRYIAIDTTADILINNAVAASVDVDIDPWIFMFGIGTTF